MNITTSGIVLHSTKYADTSLIVKIYTEMHGTQSFIIKGAFSKKSRIRASLFSPLALVSVTYDDHFENTLKFIKDISRKSDANLFDPAKSAILLFYNEVIYKLLFDAGPDPILFHFLETEIERIEWQDTNLIDLPIRFLIQLSIILGFFPENNYSEKECYFSIEACRFQQFYIDENNEMDKEESLYFSKLLNGEEVMAPRSTRNKLLHMLIEYYKRHNEQIREIESAEILSTVLHD
ncbi:MAG: DNA repair protein RecO [Bacteroidales bacterium]|nr:DNA repair protein RecO [Bacteroidales bacterium]